MSVVGIDLGTTNTVVGCVRSGKVHVLADDKGTRLLPSVVSFHPNGEVLVGGAAKARRVIDAKNTVYSHKRLIGRSWNSTEITQARQRFAFELREGPGQGPLVHARGQDYTLPEISAFVLKRARQIAETALGTPVERAVITVPAHFNELQRASTKVAGRVSGLEVLRILNEPTAAALAYGLGRKGSERVAVYDFGGGTFDCTLLDLNGNVFEVLASAGDSFLGGDDVDALIADRVAEAFLKQHRQDPRQDSQNLERLKVAAEEVKIALSSAESHTVMIKELGHGAGGSTLNFEFTLNRKELDVMVTPLVDRSFKVTQDALALARLSPTSFDKVILVGGTTRMPVVRKRVESFFGSPPMDRVNPEEVVAIGAAIQAAALTEGMRRRSIPAPPPGAPRPPEPSTEIAQTSEVDPAALMAASPSPGDKKFAFASTVDAGKKEPPRESFGAIDETPSLFSTPSGSLPSFPSLSATAQGVPSPLGDDPTPWRQAEAAARPAGEFEGGFGHVEEAPEPFGPMEKVEQTLVPNTQRALPPGTKAPQIAKRQPTAPFAQKPPVPTHTAPLPSPRAARDAAQLTTPRAARDAAQLAAPLPPPPKPAVPTHTAQLAAPPPPPPQRPGTQAFGSPQPRGQSHVGALPSAPPPLLAYASAPPPLQSPLSSPPPHHISGSAPPQPHGSQPPIFGAYSSSPPQAPAPMPYPPGAFDPQIPSAPPAQFQSPVLVDVTPRGLVVETAGGYTDTIIPRNSKIPCERTRRFATGRDMQTSVRVRVAQGEHAMFPQNTFLGEVELSGLRPAPRGEVTVAVTFEVDADGTLRIRARDVQTGQEARATLQLIGVADESSVVMMINRLANQPVVGGSSQH